VTVDAVEADVELAAQVPLRVGRLPFVELRKRLEPGDALTAFGLPELIEVPLVDLGPRACAAKPLGGGYRRSSRNMVSIAAPRVGSVKA
jgi:hypothetical protein